MIFFLILTIFCFSDFINANTKVTIKCDKNTNSCNILEKRIVLGDSNKVIDSNQILYAKSNLIGCGRYGMSCNYSLRIHMKNRSVITTYYGFRNKSGVEQAANWINEYVESSKYDKLVISPEKSSIIVTDTLIGAFLIPLMSIFITWGFLQNSNKVGNK